MRIAFPESSRAESSCSEDQTAPRGHMASHVLGAWKQKPVGQAVGQPQAHSTVLQREGLWEAAGHRACFPAISPAPISPWDHLAEVQLGNLNATTEAVTFFRDKLNKKQTPGPRLRRDSRMWAGPGLILSKIQGEGPCSGFLSFCVMEPGLEVWWLWGP